MARARKTPRYSKVTRRMWVDERFLRLSPLKPSGQALWVYLLTCPEMTNVPGVIVSGKAAMSESLGWTGEAFGEAFGELLREGMVQADWKARLVFIPRAVRHNPPESPNAILGWRDTVRELGDSPLKRLVLQELQAFVQGMGEAFPKAFAQAFGEDMGEALAQPCAIQEQEQEQEQEGEEDPPYPPLSKRTEQPKHAEAKRQALTGSATDDDRDWPWPPQDVRGLLTFDDCPKPMAPRFFSGSDLFQVLAYLSRKIKPRDGIAFPPAPNLFGNESAYENAAIWFEHQALGRWESPSQLAIESVFDYLHSDFATRILAESKRSPGLKTWLRDYERNAPWLERDAQEAAKIEEKAS